MEEFLKELENFKYNLNMSDLENFKLDENIANLEELENEINEKIENIKELESKISNLDNYKKNGQGLYDRERRANLVNYVKNAELNENSNDHLINSLNIDIKYLDDEKLKKLKQSELDDALKNKDKLASITQEYKDILDNFDKLKKDNNDIYDEKLNNDKYELHLSKEELKKMEIKKSIILFDYRKELDSLINNVKNNNINLEDAKSEFNTIVKNIDPEFLENDLLDRDRELEDNKLMQNELEIKIKYLEEKLSNKDNYLNSIFVVEKNNDMIRKWETKKNNIEIELKKHDLEKSNIKTNINEYLDIIDLCKNENSEIQRMLRKEENPDLENKLLVNDEIIKEAIISLEELNNEIKENEKTISEVELKRNRIETVYNNLNKRDMENEINLSDIRLDEIKLSSMVSDLNALKNRNNHLSVSLDENIEKVNDIKEVEPKEIKSIKRPIKNKMIDKLKKIAKIVIASMATVVVVGSFSPKEEEQIISEPNDNFTMEDLINENELENINLEEDFIKISDNITIKEEAGIYKNQYDSSSKTNPYNPRYDRNEMREVIGVSLMDQEGNLTFVQNEGELIEKLNEGYTVASYLTEKDNTPEGFWNANDVVKTKSIDSIVMGGMSK